MVEKYLIENYSVVKSDKGIILNYFNINDDEKKILNEEYKIDLHSIISSLDPDEVPRLEIEMKNINLIWKLPDTLKLGDTASFDVISAGFFIRNGKLIIISQEKISYLNEKPVIQINSLYDLLLALLNSTVIHYIEHLKAIKLVSRDLQKKINESMENEYLLKMFDLSEILVYYLDSINGNMQILNKLNLYFNTEAISFNKEFYQDIINEFEQASKQAGIYSQIFAGLMDARGSIVNNNMNVLIRNLTIINIIFLPLNLLASIGGMSEYTDITRNIPKWISYGLLTAGLILIGWITLIFINKTSKIKKRKKIS